MSFTTVRQNPVVYIPVKYSFRSQLNYIVCYYCLTINLREGNVFSHVCLSDCQFGVRGDFRAVTCDVLDLTTPGTSNPPNMYKLVQLGLTSQPLPLGAWLPEHETHTINKWAAGTLMEGFVFVNILIFS